MASWIPSSFTTPFFKAAAKVVESKRARTTSQEKPDGNSIEMETGANLDVGKRFVNSLIYFLSHGYNIFMWKCC